MEASKTKIWRIKKGSFPWNEPFSIIHLRMIKKLHLIPSLIHLDHRSNY